jgi:hypothetical protein
LTLPSEWPVGAGELRIVGTGGVRFEERRDVIVYEDSHVILVQTSSSTYRPGDILEFRVVATNENLIPIENGEITLEIYVSQSDSGFHFLSLFLFIVGCYSQTRFGISTISHSFRYVVVHFEFDPLFFFTLFLFQV